MGVRSDVDRMLGEATLLVHPARQEPLGRVLLEAAAAGIAVVTTTVGGTREIFPPDRNAAILVPPTIPSRWRTQSSASSMIRRYEQLWGCPPAEWLKTILSTTAPRGPR